MNQYSEKLKQTMAAKILRPDGQSALSLAAETGISQTTLSKWAREYKNKGGFLMGQTHRRPKDWSRAERFQAIIDSAKLSSTEFGAYLRKNGLTSAHIEKWKQEFISGENCSKVGRPGKDPEMKKLEQKLKVTERDLRNKDKALAEASALLILKKKAQSIWGEPGGDE